MSGPVSLASMDQPCVTCGVPVPQPSRGRPRVACSRGHRPSRIDRTEERAKYVRPSRAAEPLPVLRPELQRGGAVAFWEDELRLDLQQERELAKLQNRNPDKAAERYRAREMAWYNLTESIDGPQLGTRRHDPQAASGAGR
jgi:hypothetical protein